MKYSQDFRNHTKKSCSLSIIVFLHVHAYLIELTKKFSLYIVNTKTIHLDFKKVPKLSIQTYLLKTAQTRNLSLNKLMRSFHKLLSSHWLAQAILLHQLKQAAVISLNWHGLSLEFVNTLMVWQSYWLQLIN